LEHVVGHITAALVEWREDVDECYENEEREVRIKG
jgi:hypothetical protein